MVKLEAQVVLLALGSGLPGASVVSQPPEDYGKTLSPTSGDFRAAARVPGGRHPKSVHKPVSSSLSSTASLNPEMLTPQRLVSSD